MILYQFTLVFSVSPKNETDVNNEEVQSQIHEARDVVPRYN